MLWSIIAAATTQTNFTVTYLDQAFSSMVGAINIRGMKYGKSLGQCLIFKISQFFNTNDKKTALDCLLNPKPALILCDSKCFERGKHRQQPLSTLLYHLQEPDYWGFWLRLSANRPLLRQSRTLTLQLSSASVCFDRSETNITCIVRLYFRSITVSHISGFSGFGLFLTPRAWLPRVSHISAHA